MGRTASINKIEVAEARARLRATDAPHGIIAIRKHLGRGSPQLIGRFLDELDGAAPATAPPLSQQVIDKLAERIASALSNASTDPSARFSLTPVGAPKAQWEQAKSSISERDQHIEQLRRDLMAVERRAAALDAENTLLRASISDLHDDLGAQRDLFDAWRRDHVHDRALLASRIERLGAAVAPPGAPASQKRKQATGEQLDLYGNPSNDK